MSAATSIDRMLRASQVRCGWRAGCRQFGLWLSLLGAAALQGGPVDGTVVAGNASIASGGSTTTITAENNSVLRWGSFDVAANETVQFVQPDAAARVLNWIGGATPSQIDGSLVANGQVYLVNPSGVYFGRTAVVDVGVLYAIGGELSREDFLAGRDRFTSLTGAVRNDGTLRGSSFALVGRTVRNTGTIVAPDGFVALAAGQQVVLSGSGSRIYVETGAVTTASPGVTPTGEGVSSTGTIDAGQGSVVLAAGDLYAVAITHDGRLAARDVKLQGQGRGDVLVNGTIDAASEEGAAGGRIEVTGERVGLLENATLNASGGAGGGTILVGGDYQGGNPDVRNATATTVMSGAALNADALAAGEGGKVIVWADGATRFLGQVSARGGAMGGDGGFVEVSGKQALSFGGRVNTTASHGTTGTLLLDPATLVISHAAAGGTYDGAVDLNAAPHLWAFGDVGSKISDFDLNSVLQNTSLELQASTTIEVQNGVTVDLRNRSLTLTAGTDLTFGAATFNSTGGGGALVVNYGATGGNGTLSLGGLSLGTGVTATAVGGAGANALVGPNAATTWTITGAGAGEVAGVTFTGTETLNGGAGTDTVVLTQDGKIELDDLSVNVDDTPWVALGGFEAAALQGGASANQIDASGWGGEALILASGGADSITGNGATTTLVGQDMVNAWQVTAVQGGTLNGATFSAVGTLRGGSGVDAFTFSGGSMGAADGGAGADTFSFNGGTVTTASGGDDADTFTLGAGAVGAIVGGTGGTNADVLANAGAVVLSGSQAGTAAGGVSFSEIETLASGGAFSLTGTGAADTFVVNAANGGTVAGLTFGGYDTLHGAGGDDSFMISGGSVATLTGGAGADTFTFNGGTVTTADGGDDGDTFDLGASTIGTVSGAGGGDSFTISGGAVATLTGGVGADTFSFNGGTVTTADGGDDGDTFTLGAGTVTSISGGNGGNDADALNNAGDVELSGSQAGTAAGGTSFSEIETLASGGAFSLTGTGAADAFVINAANGGTVADLTFDGYETLNGEDGNDSFTSSAGSMTTLNGGAGTDAFSFNGGTVATANGGDDGDTFNLGGGAVGTITGGSGGTDADVLANAGDVELSGSQAGTAAGGTSFSEIETLASGGAFSLTGTGAAEAFVVNAANGGTVAGLTFGGYDTLNGAGGSDSFTISGGSVVTLNGGTGADTFDFNGGTVASVSGGDDADTFNLGAGGVGTMAGGDGGTDADVLNNAGDVVLSGSQTGTAGGGTTFSEIETLASGGMFRLTGTAAADTFVVNAANGGTVRELHFSGYNRLSGGAGGDTFTLEVAAAGMTLEGGDGADTLQGRDDFDDEFALNGAIALTGVTASGFETADGRGGRDSFTVTAPTTANLIGGADDDLFTINADLSGSISGGAGSDTLTGSAINAVTLTSTAADGFGGTEAEVGGGFSGIDVVQGSGAATSLTGRDASATWTLAAEQTYESEGRELRFEGFSTLQGGSGADTFNVTVATSADLKGGAGGDTFTLAAALTGTAAGEAGDDLFTLSNGSATSLDGGADSDTLGASAGDDSFVVNQPSGGMLNGGQGFVSIENLSGNGGNDSFTISAGSMTSLDGGAGADTFAFDGGTVAAADGGDDGDTFNLSVGAVGMVTGGAGGTDADVLNSAGDVGLSGSQAGVARATTSFTEIETLNSGGTFRLTGTAAADAFVVSTGNGGTVRELTFSGYDRLSGGAGDDTFTLDVAGTGMTLEGGDGLDTLQGRDDFDDEFAFGGALGLAGVTVSGFETADGRGGNDRFTVAAPTTANLIGGAGDDLFTIDAALTGSVSGGLGSDKLTGSAINVVTLTSAGADGFGGTEMDVTGGFSGLDRVTGSGALTSLTGRDAAAAWTLAAAPTYESDGRVLQFEGFATLQGGSGADTFAVIATTTADVKGGAGNDTFTLTAALTGAAAGEAGDDLFTLNGGSATSIDGGDDSDTLGGSTGNDSFVINQPGGGTMNGSHGFVSIENLSGNEGDDTFTLTGTGTMNSLAGGAGADRFVFDGGAMTSVAGDDGDDVFVLNGGAIGSIHGGAGTDELQGRDDAADLLEVTLANAGTVAAGPTFDGIDVLSGRGGDDTFKFSGGSVAAAHGGAGNDLFALLGGTVATVAGGEGADTLEGAGNVTLTGIMSGAAASTTFAEIETLNSGGTFSLTGTSGSDSFVVSSTHGGTVAGLSFSGYSSLVGADGNDSFYVNANIGSVSGGSGNDSFSFRNGSVASASGDDGDDSFSLSGGSVASIDGGGDSDSLDGAGDVTLSGDGSGTTDGVSFGGIEALFGGGSAVLIGTSNADRFVIDSANGGSVAGLTFSGYSTLRGAVGDDTFVFASGSMASVDGDEGADNFAVGGGSVGALEGGDGADTFTFTAGAVTAAGGDAGNDTFVLDGGKVTSISGGSDADMLQGREDAADTFAVAAANTGAVAGGPSFTEIEAVAGRGGRDTVTLTSGDDVVEVKGPNAIKAYGIDFSQIEAVDAMGPAASDTVVLTDADDTVNAGGESVASMYNIEFSGFETVSGGGGTDTLVPSSDVVLTGDNAARVSLISFSAFERIVPTATGIVLHGTASADDWSVSGLNAGSVRGFQFQNIADIGSGGAATDHVTFLSSAADLTGTVSGEGGALRISVGNVDATLTGRLSATGVRFSAETGGVLHASNPTNAVAVVAADGGGSVDYRNGGALTVGAVDGVNGATARNVTVSTVAGEVDVEVAAMPGVLTVNAAGGANLGAVSAGILVITAGGPVTDDGNVTINGAAAIDAGANDITLGDTTSANFGTLSLVGGTVNVREGSAVNLAQVEAGTLAVSAASDLTLGAGRIAVSGDATFAASGKVTNLAGTTLTVNGEAKFNLASGSIALGSHGVGAIDFGRLRLEVAGGTVDIIEDSAMRVSGEVAGDSRTAVALRAEGIDFAGFTAPTLVATSTGPITNSGALKVSGLATFDTDGRQSITLDAAENDLSRVALVGADIVVRDANALTLEAVQASGGFSASAGTELTVAGELIGAGNVSIRATHGDVIVDAPVKSTAGATSVEAGGRARFLVPLSIRGLFTVDAGVAGVVFEETLAGDGLSADLRVNTAGPTVFNGAVGAASSLLSLTTDAAGTTVINGGTVTTAGAQTFSDAVTLGADAVFSSTGGGAITFGSTVDGAQAFTVNTAGLTSFSGTIGAGSALTSLTTDGAGTTLIGGTGIATTGTQTYGDGVTLGAEVVLTSAGNGAITFAATVDGAQALRVNTGGTTTFGGAVGSATPLASLTTDSPGEVVINGGAISTTGAQAYLDPLRLGANTTLVASAGDLTFGAEVSAKDLELVARAPTGVLTAVANLGSEEAPLGSLLAYGKSLVIGGDIWAKKDIRLAIGVGVGTAAGGELSHDYLRFNSAEETGSRDTRINSESGDIILGSGAVPDSSVKTEAPLRSSIFKNNPGDLLLFGRNVTVQPNERMAVSHGSLVAIADGTGSGEGTITLSSTAVANYLVLVSSATPSVTEPGIRFRSRGPADVDLGRRNPAGQDHGTDLGADLVAGAVLIFDATMSDVAAVPTRSSFKPASVPGPTTDPALFDYWTYSGNIPTNLGLAAVAVLPDEQGSLHNVFVADLLTKRSYRPYVPFLVYLDLSTAAGFGEYRDQFIDFDADTFGLTDVNPIRTLVSTGAQVRNAVEQTFTPTAPRDDVASAPIEADLAMAIREQLQALGIYARPLTEAERRSRERRSGLFVTVPPQEHPREADYEVADARVEDRAVRDVLRAASEAGLIGAGQERLAEVAQALAATFEVFAPDHPTAGGGEFRAWLEARDDTDAGRVLEFARVLQAALQRIELLGLTAQELEGSRAQIYGSVLAARLNAEPEFLRALVESLPPVDRTASLMSPYGVGTSRAVDPLFPVSLVP